MAEWRTLMVTPEGVVVEFDGSEKRERPATLEEAVEAYAESGSNAQRDREPVPLDKDQLKAIRAEPETADQVIRDAISTAIRPAPHPDALRARLIEHFEKAGLEWKGSRDKYIEERGLTQYFDGSLDA